MSPICPFRYPPGRLLWLPLAACALWLALVFGLYRQALHAETAHRLELERTRLATVARQLLDVRNWNAAHGGVYVRQSPYGPPNPWLPEEDRTLAVADGRTLVLMNPAYMSRQLAERVAEPGLRISIVSPHPLRPDNLADAWESGALARCTEGAREIFAPPQADGQGRLRLLSVLTAGQDCLRCHHDRAEGEILGGISVSQDATDFQRGLATQVRHMHLLYGLLGLTGVLSVGSASLYLTRRRWLAEETSRLKSALLARLGHDMRTPLSAMLGMAELLRRPDLRAPEKNRALDYLTQAGGALLEMVGDITDHALWNRLRPLLGKSLQSAGLSGGMPGPLPSCGRGQRAFSCAWAAPDLPQTVTGDCFRLRQALGNLVSNAVKFTELGGVQVDVRAQSEGDRLRCVLAVTDTGPGLRPEEQERVFANFQRGRPLPVALARAWAWAWPPAGPTYGRRGAPFAPALARARFTLEVLLRPAATPAASAALPPEPAGPAPSSGALAAPPLPRAAGRDALPGLRVLLVEDNPATAYYLQQMLTRAGAAVRALDDGDAALALLRDASRGPWDVLLLDACLPGRSGLDLLEAVRQGRTAVPSDQKILLCTASPAMTETAEARRRAALADGLLRKPFTFAVLRQALAATLGPATPLPVWDRQAALAAVDNDPPSWPNWRPWPRRICGKGPLPWPRCPWRPPAARNCAARPMPAKTLRAACALSPCAVPPPRWSRPARRMRLPPARR